MARICAALQFETRLPIPVQGWRDDRLVRSLRYFPLAGALIGLLAGLVWWIGALVVPATVAAGVALAVLVILGGGLHEDGLADLADALGGGHGRERALEIMRDSRIGTYGTLALVFTIALRWMVLAGLGIGAGFVAIVVAPAIGRAVVVPATALASPARPDGLGASIGRGAGQTDVAIALAIALGLALLAGGTGILALLIAMVAGLIILAIAVRRLGGHTGDVLGAVAVTAETVAFVVLAGAAT